MSAGKIGPKQFMLEPHKRFQKVQVRIAKSLVAVGAQKLGRLGRFMAQLPSIINPEYLPRLSIAGQDYFLKENKPQLIGSNLRDSVFINPKGFSHLVRKVLLEKNHVTLDARSGIDRVRLFVNGQTSIYILRPGESQGKFEVFNLYRQKSLVHPGSQPLQAIASEEFLLSLLDQNSDGKFRINSFSIPRKGLKLEAVAQNPADEAEAFILKPNDIILLPLGSVKAGLGILWLPLVFGETPISLPAVSPERVLRDVMPKETADPEINYEELAKQAIQEVETLAKETRQFYLDLVPKKYRAVITREANKAFLSRGLGKTIDDFIEIMAKSWLVKNKLFQAIVKECGFTFVDNSHIAVMPNTNQSIIALSQTGSLIVIGSPDRNGKRDSYYGRIKERHTSSIVPNSRGRLLSSVQIGRRLKASGFTTSPLISFAEKDGIEDREGLTRAYHTLSGAFNSVDSIIDLDDHRD